jgi:hypothetical protein
MHQLIVFALLVAAVSASVNDLEWEQFKVRYEFIESLYRITLLQM